MLLSMTGFGNASRSSDAAHVSVELKAVNNRYLKIGMRLPEVAAAFEGDIEKIIRSRIARGSVQLSFRIRMASANNGFQIDRNAVKAYSSQLEEIAGGGSVPTLAEILQLPGVISEADGFANSREVLWPLISDAVNDALQHFEDFRQQEGQSMVGDLQEQCDTITEQLRQVAAKAPDVVSSYREKLIDRVKKGVEEAGVRIEESDVIREVALFADRCDINEEITRLKSHRQQFETFLASDQSLGRKLEFVSQEMFREINTIGSKANNVEVAHCVVEMKAAIERIREILQNVE